MAGTSLHDTERAVVLLLQALGSEQNGCLAAHRVLQGFPGPFPWINVMEVLCMKVPTMDESTGEMLLKPKLVLLPLQTQRNLFRLLDLIHYRLPAPAIELCLQTISVEKDFSDTWLHCARQTFLTTCGIQTSLQHSEVSESLHTICQQLNQTPCGHFNLGWYKNPCAPMEHAPVIDFECRTVIDDKGSPVNDIPKELFTDSQQLSSLQVANIENTEEITILPASIEAHAPTLKQLLYIHMESESLDHEFLEQLNKIFDLCSPLQVLSLTSPASRTLIAAVSMFCNKYALSVCSSLIGPILIQAKPGTVYADFICRMVSECLQPHQLHFCLSPILDASCTDVSITVLHLLIDKKDKFCQSEIDPLLNYLCHAAEKFSKSVTFSKLLLVLLTSKPNLIHLSHLGPLTSALNCNQTFMKKSLQNALKKVAEKRQLPDLTVCV
ncbi:Fanconi anemia group E protein isoform X3 [Pyxicephalus adspersus]|uniref:Fanconi anemia group E protein isoform X3 n=1 Tax=Pyxicephalus adspersus TaxID=30357 RepID=UPI003B5CB757